MRELLEAYEDEVGFYSPDICFDDARKYIPDVSGRHKIDPAMGLAVLDEVSHWVESVDRSLARERVLPRDPDDWPIISVALLLARFVTLRSSERYARATFLRIRYGSDEHSRRRR